MTVDPGAAPRRPPHAKSHDFATTSRANRGDRLPLLETETLKSCFYLPGYMDTLSDYCADLLDRIGERTGRPLRSVAVAGLEFDSQLHVAHPGEAAHELVYRPECTRHYIHLLTNAAYKVLRFCTQRDAERLVPVGEIRRLRAENERELRQKIPTLPQPGLEVVSRFLYAGLIRQLTSFPVDLRVENEIRYSLRRHHRRQEEYLKTQVRDFLPTLSLDLKRVTPTAVYLPSTAMNIAFAEVCAQLLQTRPPTAITTHSSRSLAEELLHDLQTVHEDGATGDRLLTDTWAKRLGLRPSYRWSRWDQAPR